MDKTVTKKVVSMLVCIVVGLIISFLPPPEGLGIASMRFLGIFVGLLFLLLVQAFDDWVVSLFALSLLAIFNVQKINVIFAPFGQGTIWLVIGVIAMAVGVGNSGLLKRIALKMMTLFPTTYNGMILSMMTTGIVLTPIVSSVLGKATLMAPIATNITEQAGFKERSRPALGLFVATFMTTYIIGNAFLSGSANPGILMGFMTEAEKASMTWVTWFLASSVWCLAIIVGTYLFCRFYCKPEKGEMQELSSDFFKERLAELGQVSNLEKISTIVVILALTGWITQSMHGIDAGMIALLAAATLAACGLFKVTDLMTKIPWNLIIFICALLSISSLMTSLGVSAWLTKLLGPVLQPIISSPWIFIPVLCLVVFAMRGVVVSIMATLTIMIAIFGPFMEAAGMSMFILLFVVYMCTNIWYMDYQNPLLLSVVAAAGNKYVTYKEFRIASVLYMAATLIGFVASIPVWQMMGLIW